MTCMKPLPSIGSLAALLFLAAKGATVDAMHAATASLTGTTTRKDGSVQVTYNGHPLYYYSADKNPGDVLCQGAVDHGGAWYVVDPQGNAITKTYPLRCMTELYPEIEPYDRGMLDVPE